MAVSVQRPKVFNPQGKKKPATKRTKNPAGYLAALGYLNPNTKGKKHMPAKRKKAATASASKRKSSKKPMPKSRNPLFSFKPKSKPRKSNPDRIQPVQMLKEGALVLTGLISARQLPQLALGTKNNGPIGYAANFGIAAIGGVIIGMTVSPRAGFAFAAGGAAYGISRIATENLSPVGKYFALAGVGDASAASMGDVRRARLGIVVPSSFSYPQLTTPGGQVQIPPHIQQYVQQEQSRALQMAAPTVGRYRR